MGVEFNIKSLTVGDGSPVADLDQLPPIERRRSARRRLHVEIPEPLYAKIIALCAARRVPVNQAVRELLERHFR